MSPSSEAVGTTVLQMARRVMKRETVSAEGSVKVAGELTRFERGGCGGVGVGVSEEGVGMW